MQQKAYIQGAFVAADQKKALWQMLLVLFALALTLAQYFSYFARMVVPRAGCCFAALRAVA